MSKADNADSADKKNNQSAGPKPEPQTEHRAVILFRSALVGAATMLPVPLVSDALAQTLRRSLLQQIASLRRVEIQGEALDTLLSESEERQRLTLLSGLSGLFAWLKPRGRLRRMVTGLQFLRAVEHSVRIFHLASLLDHYAANYHAGGVIKEADARKLRDAMDDAVHTAQHDLATQALNGALTALGRLIMALPGFVFNKVRHTEPAPSLPLHEVAEQTHELLRDLTLQSYLGRLAGSFDRKWGGGAVITVS